MDSKQWIVKERRQYNKTEIKEGKEDEAERTNLIHCTQSTAWNEKVKTTQIRGAACLKLVPLC